MTAPAPTRPPAAVDRALRVEPVMGTVVSLDVRLHARPAGDVDPALDAAVAALHAADADFSTWKGSSWVSRLQRGEVDEAGCPPHVRAVLAACREVERETGGAFSARWAGRTDPTGYVKGWAAERAGEALTVAGFRDWCLVAGGDVLVSGRPAPGRDWHVGVVDPADRDRLVAAVATGGDVRAVATSGTAERGAHVVDPRTGRPATALASVTVTARDLVTADCWATAVLAAGEAPEPLLAALDARGCGWLLVDSAGRVRASAGFPAGGAR